MKEKHIYIGILLHCFLFANSQVDRELKQLPNQIHNSSADTPSLNKTYYKLSHREGLMGRGKPTVYADKNLTAIQFPVGGIGTGCVQFDGTAKPRYWQIFNNMTHDALPNTFFAIRTEQDKKTYVRALQTSAIKGIKSVKAVKAQSDFPFLKFMFETDLPIQVTMGVGNPFIPTDLKNSGIPAIFYEFQLHNPSDKPLKVALLASQQNAVGFSKIKKISDGKSFAERFKKSIHRKPVVGNKSVMYGANYNKVVPEYGSQTLYMEADYPKNDAHFGQMALFALPVKGGQINATARWKSIASLVKQFKKTGGLKSVPRTSKSKKGTTYSGATTVQFTLKPAERKTIHMVLAWYFPNGKNGGHLDRWDSWGKGKWEGKGNYYAHHWSGIRDLTKYLYENHQKLIEKTKLFTQTFNQTNFPYWLNERLINQLATLKSRTIFHDKNNYVGLWEGNGAGDGSCAGNCNHVWHYAQVHARLFPSLGRRIREQSFDLIKENGALPYRQPRGDFAFDGQLGEILSAYREHLLSDSNRWLVSKYSAIKKALNYVIKKYDSDKDGWLNSAPKHTTYDASMSGNPSFLTSLYLAALRAGVEMARITGDVKQTKEWQKIAQESAKIQSKRLFNGDYFIQIPGGHHATDYDTGCQSDQLLGQWWADQIGLGNLYPPYQIRRANQSILKYNFKAHLKNHHQGGRFFALPSESGFIGTTWPRGNRPPYASGYSDEIWTTYEYTIGAALLRQRLVRDALTILRAGFDRYNGELKITYPSKNGWGNFGFSGNPFGDDECGQFYGRALSNWSVLLAAQGFQYDGPKKMLGFNPNWQPDNHRSFFSTAKGWGVFTQKMDDQKQYNKISLSYGALALKQLQLHRRDTAKNRLTIKFNNQSIDAKIAFNGEHVIISFQQTLNLKAGDVVEVVIEK